MPQIIFITLFQHCNCYHKNQWHHPTVWRDWCDVLKNESKKQRQKEVNVGCSSELFIQIKRQKCKQSVFRCAKFVCFFVDAKSCLYFLQVNVELSKEMFREFVANDQNSVIIGLSVSPKLYYTFLQSSRWNSKGTWQQKEWYVINGMIIYSTNLIWCYKYK